MRVSAASEPSLPAKASEDWYSASEDLIVVLDGATARTETGCVHGTAWYTTRLGLALTAAAADRSRSLPDALARAIELVAAEHPECDLTHPGTPSAAAGMLRINKAALEHAVLGDVTVVVESRTGPVRALTDSRVEGTARAQRDAADRLPIDSPEKLAILVEMKHAELAARNTANGYWVAASDPSVASHALVGGTPVGDVRRAAVLTDGAARAVQPLTLLDWPDVLNLLDHRGPQSLLELVRHAEAEDPAGARWPRNKRSDDATVVFWSFEPEPLE
jgi:Protein phosphatase 2C